MAFDVRRLDIYRKVPKDLTQPTRTGALISVGCVLFILYLFLAELHSFITISTNSELFVDNAKKEGRISVRINISTPFLDCQYVGLDIQDDMGRHEVGFVEDTAKTPLDEGGCRFEARFNINKIPGNFHLSTHSARSQPQQPDMRHVIHSVIFGDDILALKDHTGGRYNPLEHRNTLASSDGRQSHDYIIKVVPTIYEELSGDILEGYQYTYAHREYLNMHHSGMAIPAIWFRYDLTPITVKYTEQRKPIYSFLTTVCAIVGGTFTVAGIVDGLVFSATEYYRKLELGKVT